MKYRHIALFAGADLRAAVEYYEHLFGLDVIVREGHVDGVWGELPPDKTWDEAAAAGAAIEMAALQKGDVVLALFSAEPTGERFYAVGIDMPADEVDAVADRLEEEPIESRGEGHVAFVDRYGVRWQLSSGAPFRGAGTIRGAWLEV